MKKHSLNATLRTITGSKVKQLRKQGLIPATVYGKNFNSISVTVPKEDFLKISKEIGETGLIELSLKDDVLPVLANTVQINPVTRDPIHIEFHKVDLKEKVKAKVPVVTVGESEVITQKLGVLLQLVNEVEVEALPADLPENIELDITSLKNVGDELKVSAMKIPAGVILITELDVNAAKIAPLVSHEAAAEEAKAAETAQAQAAESAEAAAPAASETPAKVGAKPEAPAK
jgi:large subunit ribosomal protein L25